MEDLVIRNWMRVAQQLAAQAAEAGEVPVGAVLIDEHGVLLGAGFNRREELHRITAHAEILALEEYSQRFSSWRLPEGSSLISTVEPCLMCAGALVGARVTNIFYGCPDPKGASLSLVQREILDGRFDHKMGVVRGGIDEEACAQLMRDFFRRRRLQRIKPVPSFVDDLS